MAKTWRAEWQRRGEQSGKDVESRVAKTWRAEWQRRGEQSGKDMVEMDRSDWSVLRQESSHESEAPVIPESDSTAVSLRLRNMANVI